ncbi:hypothetical protein D3C74_48570 [compost metagenome]
MVRCPFHEKVSGKAYGKCKARGVVLDNVRFNQYCKKNYYECHFSPSSTMNRATPKQKSESWEKARMTERRESNSQVRAFFILIVIIAVVILYAKYNP